MSEANSNISTLYGTLSPYGFDVTSKFIPASQARENQINWLVTIQRHNRKAFTIEYSQGVGHLPFSVIGRRTVHLDKKIKSAIETGRALAKKLKEPTKEDILYCLISDMSCSDEDFSDWCGNFGYDDDSTEDKSIYDAVQEQARNVRNLFTSEEIGELSELLEDY